MKELLSPNSSSFGLTEGSGADGDPSVKPKDDGICPPPPETGGPKGPEPTRYGDWEINGKCVDF